MKGLIKYMAVTGMYFLFLSGMPQQTAAQVKLPVYPDSLFNTYYYQRCSFFESMPLTKGDIVFLGNSITDGGEWNELFADNQLKNRGISGDFSAGVIHRLDDVVDRKPSKIFLLIGVNDLSRNISPDSLVKNIILIAAYIKQESPATQLYVQSILPVNNIFGKFTGHTSKGAQIQQVNAELKKNASAYRYTCVDLYSSFCNEEGKLDTRYSNDGLHLVGEGYLLWKHLIYPFVYDLQQKPSLIPNPVAIKWTASRFPLYACRTISINDPSLRMEGLQLLEEMKTKGLVVTLNEKETAGDNTINLQLGKVETPGHTDEAYRLEVVAGSITITANTPHGIFNGIQTLYQLMRDNVFIPGCLITDYPAFSWRAYMIDVGRNYQSVELLKKQIGVMARYKLNVFHFHATEDIAWRIAIKQYPQLTAPENMLRDKGQYYSEADLKELIRYCKERHIIFIPEIDMPGHSAAFKRAMKTDMQSDTGILVVKNILRELSDTYDLPFLHIGADEVKITNKNFIPDITTMLEGMGKKVIGWQPGGNFTEKTIRQLWKDNKIIETAGSDIQYIDSRHLYLNHMDPLETVTTVFNRQIGGQTKEDKNILGGTLCMWPDRRVGREEDVVRMNAVYPGMLAFAERTWRGGGHEGWVANIGEPLSAAATEFAEFENRLLDHKQQFFAGYSFPYVKQSGMTWKLYGPYINKGLLTQPFEPEKKNFDETKVKAAVQVTGGTVVLRHWWAPLIKGAIPDPVDSSTWYATTKIWSESDTIQSFWIGFNNLSRSPATDSPPMGAWDDKQSAIWVNGQIVPPPVWKRGGQKGNSEIPLQDEGYEYRDPTTIKLKKGWNVVLIKAPVGSFRGKDWQNPVKWMFTFVPAIN